LRTGINGTLLTGRTGYRLTGVHRYIERLLAELPSVLPDDELLVYTGRGVSLPVGLEARSARFPLDNPALRIVWERSALPLMSRRDRLDLFHGTVNTLPHGLRGRSVVTIHDLALLRWPEQVPARRYRYLAKAIPDAVRRADRVIAVSEATKRDIVELLLASPEKVVVTPLGVDSRFSPPDPEAIDAFQARHGITRPFILSVGTLEPRKNLPRLLEAFASLLDKIPHDLVLVGPEGWRQGELRERLEQLKLGDRLRMTGFVADEELPFWYAAADVVAIPSLYEGFGLPVLEAMASGGVVVTSNVSSMPEVAGDGALLVEPQSVEAIADGLTRAVQDAELRESIRARGLARAREFTWRRTAELTARVYREVLE
jgi:glycosyltransferase involved in cell wall biosynthesis